QSIIAQPRVTRLLPITIPMSTNPPTIPTPYTLSLHDALPISAVLHIGVADCIHGQRIDRSPQRTVPVHPVGRRHPEVGEQRPRKDRKSTRLNSSHVSISYAVFCWKSKNRMTYFKSIKPDDGVT